MVKRARNAGPGVRYRNHGAGNNAAGLVGDGAENAARIDLREERITKEKQAAGHGQNEQSSPKLSSAATRISGCGIDVRHSDTS